MPQNRFPSRRSTVHSRKGIVSSTQPLANAAGIKILEKGGNAIDAAVAVAAALCVTETASTDLGGDGFAIFYDSKDKKTHGLNGCGRSSKKLSTDYILKNHPDHIKDNRLNPNSPFAVNVPGCVAAWYDAIEEWGSGNVTFEEVLQPAIGLAEDGFPISEISCLLYKDSEHTLKKVNENKSEEFKKNELGIFLPNKGLTPPREGQLMKNKLLAESLKHIAKEGKKGFYEGKIAESIVKEVQSRGGLLDLEDLKSHTSTFVEPISYEFLGKKLWEIPPNGSGLIALIALGIIKTLDESGEIDLKQLEHNSTEYLHVIIETLKLAFKDSEEYVNDHIYFLEKYNVDHDATIREVLTPKYFSKRCKSFNKEKVLDNRSLKVGDLPSKMFHSDTVYFAVTDSEGNAASFITSVFHNFGSSILVPDHGFFLQNRGANFSFREDSKNVLKGGKRPYHTIIPSMITSEAQKGEELYACFGIQGGFNQPQAHVQVYLNLLLFGFNPQEAIDAPRISLSPHEDYRHSDEGRGSHGPVSTSVTLVNVDGGVDSEVVEQLRKLGHEVRVLENDKGLIFGRGQIIRKEEGDELIYSAGSDPRGDGAAVPFI